ncbi:MAG: deoxyribodipyrimidine photolyase [Spirochaetales bacterium]|nr:MAG: deoxyribodipyrimidine photolyase [Spirochaetales bacterium]
MQASQRALGNPALIYAAEQADDLNLPLLTVFGLTADYPEANLRHYVFMLQGLKETARSLRENGIGFLMAGMEPPAAALAFAGQAAVIVCDCGYLKHQQAWRKTVAVKSGKKTVMVESDVIFSAWDISHKEEWSAATLRRKMLPLRDDRLGQSETWCSFIPRPARPCTPGDVSRFLKKAGKISAMDLFDPDQDPEHTVRDITGGKKAKLSAGFMGVTGTPFFTGGTSSALTLLENFVREKLGLYADKRNHPELSIQSDLSPYLHFGQISPALAAAGAVKAAEGAGGTPGDTAALSKESFLEELIVRRELSVNFVLYNPFYDEYPCLPDWAKKTLALHAEDRRSPLYTAIELENAETVDPCWNAAMEEMKLTGKMHNYMRMYWGKKIIEWTARPEEAWSVMIRLNNKYFLDGRDPNSYAGVAWCFGKHDRPWIERPVFGSVRYMNQAGLRRKFDMDGYIRKIGTFRTSGH